MKIKTGDTVKIITGPNKNRSGKIIKSDRLRLRVRVAGLNLVKSHRRPRRQGEKGETIEIPRFISVANVALICPNCHRPARVGYRLDSDKKIRFCKKCQSKI